MLLKKINWNEWIWFSILAGFGVYIFRLLLNGEILYFLHPRMLKFALFALVVFIFLTVFQIRKLGSSSRSRKLKISYLMFIIPLILGFTVAPGGLDESSVSNRALSLAGTEGNPGSFLMIKSSEIIDTLEPGVTLEIEPALFAGILEDMTKRPERYTGQSVAIEGFIFRLDHFPENEFIIARLKIVCCAADALITGILVHYEQAQAFETSSWARIEGIIDTADYYDIWLDRTSRVPLLVANSVKQIERPLSAYIYPSDF